MVKRYYEKPIKIESLETIMLHLLNGINGLKTLKDNV